MKLPELTPTQGYLIRAALKLAGAALATHGLTRFANFINSADTIELVFGLVAVIIGLVSGYKSNTTTAIQQKAADTLPVGTVLPATTIAAPNAQVMTPESATEFIRKPTTVDQVQNSNLPAQNQ